AEASSTLPNRACVPQTPSLDDLGNRAGPLPHCCYPCVLLESQKDCSTWTFMPEITRRVDRAEMARRVDRAEKLLQKGKPPEAREEDRQAVRDDPENDVGRQLAADLGFSVGRNQDAVKLLGELFERQVT